MSGILNNKSRMLDTIVTFEGRKQIASGQLEPAWVTFTDGGTYYEADAASGSSDASTRIYFEACNLPQDQITFKADDNGRVMPFASRRNATLLNGKIFTGSLAQNLHLIENPNFGNVARNVLSSSIDNFKRLYGIGTFDDIFDENVFGAGPAEVNFTLTDDRPFPDTRAQTGNVTQMPSLFQDPKLSHLDNFLYLPPTTKVDDPSVDMTDIAQSRNFRLGYYPALSSIEALDYPAVADILQGYEALGNFQLVRFDPTSHTNRLAAQFFEIKKNELNKLVVIDFGTHVIDDPLHGHKHVYFVGKMLLDDNGTHTFFHLFTLIFE